MPDSRRGRRGIERLWLDRVGNRSFLTQVVDAPTAKTCQSSRSFPTLEVLNPTSSSWPYAMAVGSLRNLLLLGARRSGRASSKRV